MSEIRPSGKLPHMAFRWWLCASFMTTFIGMASGQTTSPTTVLTHIAVVYPAIAQSARMTGQIEVGMGVRPDGSVADTSVQRGIDLLGGMMNDAALNAASHATFECRSCAEPITPHTITFVFTFDGLDDGDKMSPPAWKQTGDRSSEVRVFGYVPFIHAPSGSGRSRAARCLWLWRCSKYVTPIFL
jgi:hypothetical protein